MLASSALSFLATSSFPAFSAFAKANSYCICCAFKFSIIFAAADAAFATVGPAILATCISFALSSAASS